MLMPIMTEFKVNSSFNSQFGMYCIGICIFVIAMALGFHKRSCLQNMHSLVHYILLQSEPDCIFIVVTEP